MVAICRVPWIEGKEQCWLLQDGSNPRDLLRINTSGSWFLLLSALMLIDCERTVWKKLFAISNADWDTERQTDRLSRHLLWIQLLLWENKTSPARAYSNWYYCWFYQEVMWQKKSPQIADDTFFTQKWIELGHVISYHIIFIIIAPFYRAVPLQSVKTIKRQEKLYAKRSRRNTYEDID